jgi:hypothetical protein
MLTRFYFALLIAAALLAAACSSTPPLMPRSDGGPDTTPEVAPPDQNPPDQGPPDGSPDQVVSQPLTAAQSFVVKGTLKLTAAPGNPMFANVPTMQEFFVRIDPVAKTLISATPGQAARSTVSSTDGLTFDVVDGLTFPLVTNTCGGSVTYSTFKFTAGKQGLSGSATGTASIFSGDVGYQFNARLDFTGVPDTEGPSLMVPPAAVDPLRALLLIASEPLAASTAVTLVSGGDTINLKPSLPNGVGVVTGFEKPQLSLRYGATYNVVVAPWVDLTGIAGATPKQLTTTAVPPLAAEDGFEGTATTVGGAKIIDATVLPPITGQRSVLMSAAYGASLPFGNMSSTQLTVRLAVAAGDRFVRFSLRPLGTFQTPAATFNTAIRVAVPGGAITVVPMPPHEPFRTQQTVPGAGNPIWMGDVRTVEVPLPDGTTNEVVFDFSTSNVSFGCGPPEPTTSYLLDDLRAE